MHFCFNLPATEIIIFLAFMMKKTLPIKVSQSDVATTAALLARKKMFVLAISTFLILVVASEGVRLVLVNG